MGSERKRSNSFLVVFLLFLVVFFGLVGVFGRYGEQSSQSTGLEGKVLGATTWYDYNWPYRTAITIDNTKVDADLTDFPVLISSTNADWADTSNGGHAEQADGGDFVFTSSDNTTVLPHEIEHYDNTTGQLIAWVKVNSLANSSDTTINVYYGNASCGNQWSTNTWSNYSHVWHLGEASWSGANGEVIDSTSSARNGTASGGVSTATGKIYRAGSFDGSDDFVNFGDNDDLTPGTTVSFQAWVKTSSSDDDDCILCKWSADEYIFGTYHDLKITQAFRLVGAGGWGNDYYNEKYSTGTVTSGQWTKVTVVKNGASLSFYFNGSASGTQTIADAAFINTTTPAHIGAQGAGYRAFTGQIEDVRMASSALSAEWISTEYNNQNSPATFYSVGVTEQGDATPPTNVTITSGYDTSGKADTITSGNWDGYNTPYFEFSGAVDSESGVKGYYIYFGTNAGANAFTDGSYQAHAGAQGATQNYTAGSLTAGESYYMIIGTENNTNSNNRSDSETKFIYKYDPTSPSAPEYVNVSPVGCSTQTSFTFTWPTASDTGGSDLAGYQYKRGSTGTINDLAVSVLTATTFSYQEGDNVFYLRSVDGAGNTSSWQTAVYCSTASVQVADGPSVSAGPSTMTVNWTSNKKTTSYVRVYEGNDYVSEQGQTSYVLSHSVKVVGLEPEKSYRYKLVWSDESGNLGESEWFNTTTSTAPQINDLKVDVLGPSTANVSWKDSISATNIVEYGEGNYATTINTSGLATTGSYKLDDLVSGKTYQLRINATSEDGTKFFAGTSFSMPPLPEITSVSYQVTNGGVPGAIVSWKTNVETTSSLFYGPAGSSKKEIATTDKVKDHTATISSLSNSSSYEFYVSGTDLYGNTAKGSILSFATPADRRPPTITDIITETSNVGLNKQDKAQIIVSWKTDEPSTSYVEYDNGLAGNDYKQKTTEDKNLTNSHLVIISDLKPSEPYHLRVNSADQQGNLSQSEDIVIIAGDVPKSIFNIITNTFENVFGWLGKII